MTPPIDSTTAAILAQLHDIQTPAAPGWWPPAVGWWLIFFAVGITVGIIAYRAFKHFQQIRCPAWHALNELDELWEEYDKEKNAVRTLQSLSSLMRRTAISMGERDEVASLTGDAWLEWLDRHAPGKLFTDVGRLFADAPYRKTSEADVLNLFDVCEAWLEHNSTKRALGGNTDQHVSV